MKEESEKTYTYYRKAQYHETDQMGIIHHSNYVKWMEEARIGYMSRMGFSYKKVFFNASRNEICTTAYSRHCFLKDGKLIALKKELPELNRIIIDCL